MGKALGTAAVVLAAALAMTLAHASSAPTGPASSQPAKELTLDLGDKVTLKAALIPAGKFLMGSPEMEKDRNPDETQHEVTISKPFYMGVTHVTVDQFTEFVKGTGYKTELEKRSNSIGTEISDGKLVVKSMPDISWRKPSFDQKGDYPAVQLSWNDSKAFCDWLSKRSGKTVYLPTEAQWEYACRAGTTTTFPWGDNPDDGKGWANCADQSLKQKLFNMPELKFFNWDDGFVYTSPAKSFRSNAFGLYDMIGNAYQWCSDGYGDYPKGAATDPTGADRAEAGEARVVRGGSWFSSLEHCRSTSRMGSNAISRGSNYGFRVAVVATLDR